MSDSLRDQLLKAGFSQAEKEPSEKRNTRRKTAQKKNRKPARNSVAQASKAQQPSANPPTSAQPDSHAPHTATTGQKKKKKKSKKAPAIKPRAGSWSTKGKFVDADTIEQPDKLRNQTNTQLAKAQTAVMSDVEKLIRQHALASYQGDQVYRYTMQDRIRDIHVTEDIRIQLSKSLLAITWIRGATFLIPAATASQIHEIDAEWTVFLAEDKPTPTINQDAADYDEFQVPDDLMW